MTESPSTSLDLRPLYLQALRCWICNNLKDCITICDYLTKKLQALSGSDNADSLSEQKHQVWFLKIRCLADSYHINESLLINEEDAGGDAQVTSTSRNTSFGLISRRPDTGNRALAQNITSSGAKLNRPKTGMISGRMHGISSRHSNRGLSSYRPLTTGLANSQSTFSRSIRPLFKYSQCKPLSKLIYQYLYNAQTSTNSFPDYRQCLEYINLANKSSRSSEVDGRRFRDGEDIFWLMASGICYFNLNMNKEAEGHFMKSRDLDKKLIEPYTWLIKIYLKMGQLGFVLKVGDEALIHCKSSIVYNWMARVQSLIGDAASAHSNLRESLKHFPIDLEALANVGYNAFYSEEPELALRCFERIQQMSMSQHVSTSQEGELRESCQLLNNLALCNFYNGNYHKVIPLFLKSFLSSESRDMTSDIWYNLSFIPLMCGLKNMARACLEISLKNNSQNFQALNNLGVIKFKDLIEDNIHFENISEMWSSSQPRLSSSNELSNLEDLDELTVKYDEAEVHFGQLNEGSRDQHSGLATIEQPEMLFNLALLNRKRGHLLKSNIYCNLYLEHDPNNYHIANLLSDLKQLLFYDG